ncbi:hypothetical protein HanIR_Chr02g0072571 [Helianthus annuus]|nr:hypothetical protein HanIR_Chr02g0072571 [Helianthus annuus]
MYDANNTIPSRNILSRLGERSDFLPNRVQNSFSYRCTRTCRYTKPIHDQVDNNKKIHPNSSRCFRINTEFSIVLSARGVHDAIQPVLMKILRRKYMQFRKQ